MPIRNCTSAGFAVKGGDAIQENSADKVERLPEQNPGSEPHIHFIYCNWRNVGRFRSSDTDIRICVFPWRGVLRLDGDWYNTIWELAPHVKETIVSRWTDEKDPRGKKKRARECGGFRTCLIMDVFPEHEAEWRRFLGELLADPASRHRWNDEVMEFLRIGPVPKGRSIAHI